MKIEQIQQIIEVAQVGSINRASQNLYIAQSTLSSSIKCVETELRQKLFIRTQKGIEQTEFGKIFVKYGKTILEAYQHIQSASNLQYRNGSNSAFKISIYYLLFANRLLYQMFNKYSDQNINFHYINTPRDRILFDVAHNISEIGIIAMPSLMKSQWLDLIYSYGLEYHTLSIEPTHILFGPACPLYQSNKTSVTINELHNFSQITIKENNELIKAIEAEISKTFCPSTTIQLSDRDLLIGMLHETNGYYIATMNQYAYVKEPYDPIIKSLPVVAYPFHYEFGLVKKQRTELSALADEFVAMIRSAITGNNSK